MTMGENCADHDTFCAAIDSGQLAAVSGCEAVAATVRLVHGRTNITVFGPTAALPMAGGANAT